MRLKHWHSRCCLRLFGRRHLVYCYLSSYLESNDLYEQVGRYLPRTRLGLVRNPGKPVRVTACLYVIDLLLNIGIVSKGIVSLTFDTKDKYLGLCHTASLVHNNVLLIFYAYLVWYRDVFLSVCHLSVTSNH